MRRSFYPDTTLSGYEVHVVAVDVQPRMLDGLRHRAAKAGLLERIDVRLASPDSLGLADMAGAVDFTLAFAVVHELPVTNRLFTQVAEVSRSGAQLLLVEPAGHVKIAEFESELGDAAEAGFQAIERPSIRRSHAALLKKG